MPLPFRTPCPRILPLAALLVLAACPDDGEPPRDAGPSAGRPDAAVDLGAVDLGEEDLGPEDLGTAEDLGATDLGAAEDMGGDMGNGGSSGPPTSWAFVPIADNAQFPNMAFGQLTTALDGRGRVAWRAFREEGGTSIWASDGVTPVAAVYDGGTPMPNGDSFDIERPVLTEGGVFAGYYNENVPVDQAMVVGDITGRPLTFVAGRGLERSELDGFFNFLVGPSVNESGQVAFCSSISRNDTSRASCFRGDGSKEPTDLLDGTDWTTVSTTRIDDVGGVWSYVRNSETREFALIHIDVNGAVDVRLREADVAPADLTPLFALDPAGGRAVMAVRTVEGMGLVSVDANGFETLVEPGTLEQVRAVGVAGRHVVFSVDRNDSRPGALLRTDALDDPILEVGDTFRGATIGSFSYSGSVNASGQVSFAYTLDRMTAEQVAEAGAARGDPTFR